MGCRCFSVLLPLPREPGKEDLSPLAKCPPAATGRRPRSVQRAGATNHLRAGGLSLAPRPVILRHFGSLVASPFLAGSSS